MWKAKFLSQKLCVAHGPLLVPKTISECSRAQHYFYHNTKALLAFFWGGRGAMFLFALILRGSARTSAWSWQWHQSGCCVGQYHVLSVKQQKPLLLKNVLDETKIIFIKAYPWIYIVLTWEVCRRQAAEYWDEWTSKGKTQWVWVVSWSSHFFHGNYIFYLKAWLTDTLFWFGHLVDIFSKIEEENEHVIFKKINGSLSHQW